MLKEGKRLISKDKPTPPQRDKERTKRDDGERGKRKKSASPEDGMERFRIEVGHNDKVQPGNIVGAIANEAEIDSQHIGHIRIFDSFSLIDLPEGMPPELFKHLQKVCVCGKPIAISRDKGGAKPKRGKPDSKSQKPRPRKRKPKN